MQVLIELDVETLKRLEAVAPARTRKRSAFIRAAIQKSLWELEEANTRRAYLEDPDGEAVPFDPTAWEPLPFGGFDPPVTAPKMRPGASAREPAPLRGPRKRPRAVR